MASQGTGSQRGGARVARTTVRGTGTASGIAEEAWRNEVRFVGRVAAPAELRELPSGDQIVTFRLIVPRSPEPAAGQRVDTLDCVARSARLRHRAGTLTAGAVVEVEGAIRRRFWRGPAGPTSRCEVELAALARRAAPGGPQERRRLRRSG